MSEEQKRYETPKSIYDLGDGATEKLSKRGLQWLDFAVAVLIHIEDYTVPQYGDYPNDQATRWSPEMLVSQIQKYANRHSRNMRTGQDALDCLKMAHYAGMAHRKITERDHGATIKIERGEGGQP